MNPAEGEHGTHLESAVQIAHEVRAGAVSAREVAATALARISRTNPAINAFCEVRGAEALARADEIDAQVARGEDPGLLAGVPVAIKDVVWEAGIETTNASRALLGFRPQRSAVTVERLDAAGAVLIGRTNQPEFCYRGNCDNELYGVTANPVDLALTPGGSSGGSAAAVAAGLCPVAIGSDGGGSIRIPSSFCGVVGLKQSFGLVPREPGWPGWYTLNHVGAITRCVRDSALMLQVLAGPDGRDPMSLPSLGRDYVADGQPPADLRGLRVAASEDLGYARVDEAVLLLFRDAVERFRALGAEITWTHPRVANPVGIWDTLAFSDNMASEGPLLGGGRVGEDAAQLIRLGASISAAEYAGARNAQHALAADWHRFMRDFDLVLTPTMECTAFPLGRTGPESTGGVPLDGGDEDWCHFLYPFNLTGQPAMSVPMGVVGGLPVGLQIVGGRWADHEVLCAAAAWEQAYPWAGAVSVTVVTGIDPGVLEAVQAAVLNGATTVDLAARGGIAAGSIVPTSVGEVRVRRVYSPEAGRVVVELDRGDPRSA